VGGDFGRGRSRLNSFGVERRFPGSAGQPIHSLKVFRNSPAGHRKRRVMLQNLNELEVRACCHRAEDAKHKAELTSDSASKIHFLKMETRWFALARSYQLTGVIASHLARRWQSEEQVRAGERPKPQKAVEGGTVDIISQLAWLASIVETGDDAIIGMNLDGIITTWNKGAERLYGYLAEEVTGKPVTILIPPDRQGEENLIPERVRRGVRVDHYETIRQRKDGNLIDVSLTISPMRGGDGNIVGISKIARNITERKRSEAQISALARETEHRAKNLLMVQLSQADTPDGLKEAIAGRIEALANVHSLFARSRWTGAELGSLVKQELSPYSRDGEMRTQIDGPTVMLKQDVAQSIAVALHELATNAAKYGALSEAKGQVLVEWSRETEGKLVVRWIEVGGRPSNPRHARALAPLWWRA
jgi:PAS domain S-box-containing protein